MSAESESRGDRLRRKATGENLRKLLTIATDHGPMMALAQVAYNLDFPRQRWFIESYFGFGRSTPATVPLVEVDVDRVTHNERFPFDLRGEHAVVGHGRRNWDQMTHRFTDQRLYRSIKMRFVDDTPWEQTPSISMPNDGSKTVVKLGVRRRCQN